MAHCVISAIFDTDLDRLVPACVVHTTYAPCPHDGDPACTTPRRWLLVPPGTDRGHAMTAWDDVDEQLAALLAAWRADINSVPLPPSLDTDTLLQRLEAA